MARGGPRRSASNAVEKCELVFDRKLNGFRRGLQSQLPPPPAHDSVDALPRKLRQAVALQARVGARSGGLLESSRLTTRPREPDVAAATREVSASSDAARAHSPRRPETAQGAAAGGAATQKRKKFLSAKERRKRLRAERADTEDMLHASKAPRFGEVAQAPPAFGASRIPRVQR